MAFNDLIERFNLKKFVLVLGFILAIIVLGLAIYAVFFRKAPLPEELPRKEAYENINAGLPLINARPPIAPIEVEEGKLTPEQRKEKVAKERSAREELAGASNLAKGGLTRVSVLTPENAVSPHISSDGSIKYYDKKSGLFYRVNSAGQTTLLSDKVFYNADNVTWAPDSDSAIIEYPDKSKIFYSFKDGRQATIPKHWKDFNFSPNSRNIVLKSMGISPENRWLAISNPDGTHAQAIEPLGKEDASVYPSWSPNNQVIALHTKSIDIDRQELYFIGKHKENFKSAAIEGRGLQAKWTPKGDKILYSVYSSRSDFKPELWIMGAEGDSIGAGRKNLKIETWANKCAMSTGAYAYCAIPNELPDGAGLVPEIADSIPDTLYRLNLVTGVKSKIAETVDEFNMKNLMLSEDEKYLYFTDSATGMINQIQLK